MENRSFWEGQKRAISLLIDKWLNSDDTGTHELRLETEDTVKCILNAEEKIHFDTTIELVKEILQNNFRFDAKRETHIVSLEALKDACEEELDYVKDTGEVEKIKKTFDMLSNYGSFYGKEDIDIDFQSLFKFLSGKAYEIYYGWSNWKKR